MNKQHWVSMSLGLCEFWIVCSALCACAALQVEFSLDYVHGVVYAHMLICSCILMCVICVVIHIFPSIYHVASRYACGTDRWTDTLTHHNCCIDQFCVVTVCAVTTNSATAAIKRPPGDVVGQHSSCHEPLQSANP